MCDSPVPNIGTMEVVALDFSHFLVYFLLVVVALQLLRNFVLPLVRARPTPTAVTQPETWRAPPTSAVNDELVGRVSSLFVYPFKSCRGVAVPSAVIGPRGFVMDRQFCLVTEVWCGVSAADVGWWLTTLGHYCQDGSFVTLRQVSKLALVKVAWQPDEQQLVLQCADDATAKSVGVLRVDLRKGAHETEEISVRIWDDNVMCSVVSREADGWFSAVTGVQLRLVRIGRSFERVIPENVRADPAAIDTR